MIKLDLQSRLPIYEQLKAKIGELILLGELKPGDQLPSVRSFARELGINPNTVQKAYQELERGGIIYSVTGRGSYISESNTLKSGIKEDYYKKIRQIIIQARNSGITKEEVVSFIETVFKEAAND